MSMEEEYLSACANGVCQSACEIDCQNEMELGYYDGYYSEYDGSDLDDAGYTVVVTNANWETATYIAGPFLTDLAEQYSKRWKTIELKGSADTYKGYTVAFKKGVTKLHFGCGHGYDNLYTGFHNTLLLWTSHSTVHGPNTPKEYIEGAIHYLLSCLTGKVLGLWLIEQGATAYIGWNREYRLMIGNEADPAHDPYALSTVRHTGMSGLDVLLRGGTVGEAEAYMKEQFKKYYEAWKDKNPMVAGVIAWNAKALTVLGDRNARLPESDVPPPDEPPEEGGYTIEMEIEGTTASGEGYLSIFGYKLPIRIKVTIPSRKVKGVARQN